MGDMVLVDTQTDLIRGRYAEPLDFSISGRYVINLPDGFGLKPETDAVSNLIQDKIDTFIRLHPAIPDYFFDELLTAPPPNIDPNPTQSSRYLIGPNKRTAILPGGFVTTNQLVTTGSFNTTFFHLHAFLLYSEPGDSSAAHPSPSRLLYNYEPGTGFIVFSHSDFIVEYRDAAGAVTLHTATPELEDPSFTSGVPLTFRIKFTNNSLTRTYYLSDWMFMYG
jgi:hypothetical protein